MPVQVRLGESVGIRPAGGPCGSARSDHEGYDLAVAAAGPRVESEDGQRTAKALVTVGRVVVVTAIGATIVALILVQRLSVTYRDGLAVTDASAVLVADSVDPVSALSGDLAALALTLVESLDVAQSLVESAETTLADLGAASTTNLADTATATADISDRLAATLETIERFIPGDRQSIAEELRAFADGLEPVAEQLRAIGEQLTAASSELDTGQATLTELAAQLSTTASAIEGLEPTFDSLGATAEDLQVRADAATDRMGVDLWLGRALIVSLGAVFAAIGVIAERLGRGWIVVSGDGPAAGQPRQRHVG